MTTFVAPIVVFAYDRPYHLRRTLDALAGCRGAGQTRVYAFSDGPRAPAAAERVAAVRAVLEGESRAGRFASFQVEMSPRNRGLADSIIHGVGKVLDQHGRVIVLEDDLLVSPDFLAYMNDCLEFYKDDPAVGAVTGFCPLDALPRMCDAGVFLVTRNSSQGWGTWARVWEKVDWSAAGVELLDRDWKLRQAFNREGNDRYDRLRRQLAGRIDSWSIRFGLSLFLRNLGTVYPTTNRIANIGYDGTGVHSGTGVPKNQRIAESRYELAALEVDPRIQRRFHRTYSGSLPGRLLRDILALSPRLAGWVGR